MALTAPFPWFGGKRRVAEVVWRAFGDVPNYVEPFAGSLAVLLGRPTQARIETVNDLDCYLANFWRATAADPAAVADWADWPVNEADLHARHQWLVDQADFRDRMRLDPEFFDPKIAGWWVWGICAWIGSGWCSRPGWENGRVPNGKPPLLGGGSKGVNSQGLKIERKRPMLDRGARGVISSARKFQRGQLPDLSGDGGAAGRGIHASGKNSGAIVAWMEALSDRLRRVRVCCGDWTRVIGPAVTTCIGTTGVFLDPPYSKKANRATRLYANDDMEISHAVRDWAVANGSDPKLRIAFCGYEGEHDMPEDWRCYAWRAQGGFGGQGDGSNRNFERERIWFSPHCLDHEIQKGLFDELGDWWNGQERDP